MPSGCPLPSSGTAFISVNDFDKDNVVPIAGDLANLGFRIIATRGTAQHLNARGVSAEMVYKVNEGRPNVVDHIKNGQVAMIINTPLGGGSYFDEPSIRKSATQHGVPCITTLTGAAAAVSPRLPIWARKAPNIDVGIVGAGLAGLVCADQLKRQGVMATLHDASERPGGRCHSLRGFFPRQTAERGGEFIDTGHKTMIAYARQFGVPLEDVNKSPGEIRYFFASRVYSEDAVVEELRVLVDAMRYDLRRLSNSVTADHNTPVDVAFDRMSLESYLDSRAAGPLIKAVITEAYVAEYGLATGEQSCLNFLFFIHADRRSKFRPFGVFSDERYHVIGGNDAIASGIAAARSGSPPGCITLV